MCTSCNTDQLFVAYFRSDSLGRNKRRAQQVYVQRRMCTVRIGKEKRFTLGVFNAANVQRRIEKVKVCDFR